jgi:hypothetical protein
MPRSHAPIRFSHALTRRIRSSAGSPFDTGCRAARAASSASIANSSWVSCARCRPSRSTDGRNLGTDIPCTPILLIEVNSRGDYRRTSACARSANLLAP